MARPIILSNGSLHIGLNNFGLVHDFYYPFVGLENHAAAKSLRHRIGVWEDGVFTWLDDGSWEFTFSYPYEALIGRTVAHHKKLGLIIEFEDTVDAEEDVFLRNIHIVNEQSESRNIKLFMQQVFAISDTSGGDTVQYLPEEKVLLHYKGHRAFTVGATYKDGRPFNSYTVGWFGFNGQEGSFRDAEDGELEQLAVRHGRVDSVLGFDISLKSHDSNRVYYWIAAGETAEDALEIDKKVRAEGILHRILLTDKWWHSWLEKTLIFADQIDNQYRRDFINSALLLKAHIDKRGAVIASTDTTTLNYSIDAYAYCWPRDAAYVLWPLIRLGYTEEPLLFFDFCKRVLHPKGYLMHKYQADGALGSSWHPYLHGDQVFPPIQTDETAIVLFIFCQYYQLHSSATLLDTYYGSLIKPMANFLATYIDSETKLPKPSYDLWEEVFMTTTYTTAVTQAALLTAADLADIRHESSAAKRWRTAAAGMSDAAQKYLYNETTQCFNKGIMATASGIAVDETIDSASVFGAAMFGLAPLDSHYIKNSLSTTLSAFGVSKEHPGLPRYTQDNYRRVSDASIGNPWFVTTLWLAQYYAETGQSDEAHRLLTWTQKHMVPTAALPEQINPYDDSSLSVAPLAWSQAEFMSTLLDLKLYEQK